MERAMEATSSAREGTVGTLDSTIMACTVREQLFLLRDCGCGAYLNASCLWGQDALQLSGACSQCESVLAPLDSPLSRLKSPESYPVVFSRVISCLAGRMGDYRLTGRDMGEFRVRETTGPLAFSLGRHRDRLCSLTDCGSGLILGDSHFRWALRLGGWLLDSNFNAHGAFDQVGEEVDLWFAARF